MGFHFVIIGVLILVIVIFQVSVYRGTKDKISLFGRIFPDGICNDLDVSSFDSKLSILSKKDLDAIDESVSMHQAEIDKLNKELQELKDICSSVSDEDSEEFKAQCKQEIKQLKAKITHQKNCIKEVKSASIRFKADNTVLQTIIDAINSYLFNNNSSTSDFHLIKDIVDRNVNAAEDEIDTRIPMPLYFGLMGTMLGIIVGVTYLWLSGDLGNLLSTTSDKTGNLGNFLSTTSDKTGSGGIEALLGGVAIAMISSIFGIFFTTIGSWKSKDAKTITEKQKHDFLSWMQAKLLPAMNTDAASTMRILVENLNSFNGTFAENAKKLDDSLASVADTSSAQASILSELNNLRMKDIAAANVTVYEKLKNCTTEIGSLAKFFDNINQYLSEIKGLSAKLNDTDDRVRMIEEMAEYFKSERSNMDYYAAMINKGNAQMIQSLSDSFDSLGDIIKQNYDVVKKNIIEQNNRLNTVFEEQEKVISSKASQLSDIVTALRIVDEGNKNLSKSIVEQNHKMDKLFNVISSLAKQQVGGGDFVGRSNITIPTWLKYVFAGVAIVAVIFMILVCVWVINDWSYAF